jgi:hypothetical protein
MPGERVQGATRLLLGLPLYLVAVLLSWVLVAGAVAIWLLDSSWQILTGRDGITSENPVAKVYGWYTGWFRYVAFGATDGNASRRKRWGRS